MKPLTWIRVFKCAALATGLFGAASAHAATATNKRKELVNFPASGGEKGKYAAAWVDTSLKNCKAPPAVPNCYEARALLTGRVLNASINAVSAGANVANHHFDDPNTIKLVGTDDIWFWSYFVDIFGTTLVNSGGSVWTSQAIMNAIVGQPSIDDTTPFTQRGARNLSIDLGEIHSLLGILPDAEIEIAYALSGGATTRLDVAPVTNFGALATLNLQPRASMSAAGQADYSIVVADAEVWTDGSVQVIAPNSSAKLVATYIYGTNRATAKLALDLRALKGRVKYEAHAVGFVNLASGSIWDSSTRYALYAQTPDQFTTLFDNVLQ